MSAFLSHFAFEFKTGLRNSTSLLMNYLFPLGFYAMMGLVMTKINPMFTETMIPALIVFGAMATALLGLPSPLVESREAGIFRTYKINGVPAAAILSVPVLTTLFHVIIVATVIALTGRPLFGGAAPVNTLAFALITLLTGLTFASIGALIGVVSKSSNATVLWSQLVFLPSVLLGGLMMPLSLLPRSVLPFAGLFPATHAMQAYVGLAYRAETVLDPVISVSVLLATSVLSFGLAIYLFNWDSRNNTRRGHPLMALLAVVPLIIGAALLIQT